MTAVPEDAKSSHSGSMQYFVLQVKTGGEAKFLQLASSVLRQGEGRLLWPRRKLRIRKRGTTRQVETAIFPGYLFLETGELNRETFWSLKRINGFYQFLPDNRNIEPLSGDDRELIRHFLGFGEVLDTSKVYFDENQRIRVVHGALKGLEGSVIKVDRRKRRAKVKLSLYENSFLIDFGFELLEPAEADETGKS